MSCPFDLLLLIKVLHMQEAACHTSNGGGRGRGRGRGRRAGRGAEREIEHHELGCAQFSKPGHLKVEIGDRVLDTSETKEHTPLSNARASLRNIDLNLDLADYEEDTVAPQVQPSAPVVTVAPQVQTPGPSVSQLKEEVETKNFLGWQMPEMNKMAMDPVQFALSSSHRLEEDEDYDNEE